jgi:B12-binding domain/radical SAM domain protein of rhizo-twelve system
MKYALVNPKWTFHGSIYFGCREPHLPLEYGYSQALLEKAGHEVQLVDAHLESLSDEQIVSRVARFDPDITVITTAPSYLFWRCAPPELTVPRRLARELRPVSRVMVAVGPHGSTTPRAALNKLGVDVVVMGECEEILPQLVDSWSKIPSLCYAKDGEIQIQGGPHSSDMALLPALTWPDEWIARHTHHHHRFDRPPTGPGAELETSRGCPYHCTFCAKDNFRDKYRRRPLGTILLELDLLLRQGVEYFYFVDEIFLPNRELLEVLAKRRHESGLKFGIQTRIDLWSTEMLDLLAEAGCVSIEAGVESLTVAGRSILDKNCRLSTEQLSERLIYAKRQIPFVQGNLIAMPTDDAETVCKWREWMRSAGVWANDPVPLFPYPGSPDYTIRWGAPDDRAWERAHEYYLSVFSSFSDIQEGRPLPLTELELR